MNEEHKRKISEAAKRRLQGMTDEQRAEWQRVRQEGRRRTFELIKALRAKDKRK